ncbi:MULTISPECIES: hypothetical protein [unclassified Polaribacter]|uniref:hypothetical protein n=1 Tax=unclassified Polaribacter TaxID=196858 RepID=UPI0011BF9AF3|nr:MULTISPECIES: hypothetical protein [unclassified Polaribacter]TXD48481.1 hypothetical protein ES043_17825 [Polaribacter sp. IC063]TXD62321.1 hypothetical protein ES044_02140 [Polaribacter sp. IC066]
MKKLLTLLLLTTSIIICGQEEKTAVASSKNIEAKVTSIKYSVNSIKDLENIQWDDVQSIFETNKPQEKIAISFEVDLEASKYKFKGSITVSDQKINIDSLIESAKKKVKSLIKISKKYKN